MNQLSSYGNAFALHSFNLNKRFKIIKPAAQLKKGDEITSPVER
jgi:hypothetical protein